MSLMFREMFTCPRCGRNEVYDRRRTSQGKVVQTLCFYCGKVSKVLVGPPIKTAAEIAAEKDATLRDQAALIDRLQKIRLKAAELHHEAWLGKVDQETVRVLGDLLAAHDNDYMADGVASAALRPGDLGENKLEPNTQPRKKCIREDEIREACERMIDEIYRRKQERDNHYMHDRRLYP